jgi:ABC-type ATPase with predicted acetyltransferase domain|uniref:Rubredoxin n=1 Tax=Desulfobacca acetoxidans TaxID=60893 RepID=A0A7C3SK31_9BACT
MAVYTCEKCGKAVETRCKPRKCPECGESGSLRKQENPVTTKKTGKSRLFK